MRLLMAVALPALLSGLAFGEPAGATVSLAGQDFRLEIADTPELQSLGLGGRDALGNRKGMLFLYTDRGQHAFWMKGMRFPIDIIWLDNRRIVHIEHNVPPPPQGTPDASLPVYRPDRPANAVLEIAAGIARKLGLRTGELVRFDFGGGSRRGG